MTDTSQNTESVFEEILGQAITMKASDIHVDPGKNALLIRFRVDGVLYTLDGIDPGYTNEIISKLKVMSNVDITEKRLPQDGHLEFTFGDKLYDFRVSTTPTLYGESVAIRMLNREGIVQNVEDFNFTPSQLEDVNKIINSPFGIALVTGPTGSGKSTVMYSFLNRLNKSEKNIVTLEDPIEFEMKNVRQMQINESLGWDFAKGMRSILRQDPDIIMLGEIRDEETASMAFQAALSGRLVFSTFHTFDIPGIIIRLVEMGLPRSVVAHSLTGVVSIRLVKKICDACRVEYEPDDITLKRIGMQRDGNKFTKGQGCPVCHNVGFNGRVGIFEVIPFDDQIKENVMQDHPEVSLKDLLSSRDYTDFYESGRQSVLKGITTPEEVIRVLGYKN